MSQTNEENENGGEYPATSGAFTASGHTKRVNAGRLRPRRKFASSFPTWNLWKGAITKIATVTR